MSSPLAQVVNIEQIGSRPAEKGSDCLRPFMDASTGTVAQKMHR
jgi:hypothetical protein